MEDTTFWCHQCAKQIEPLFTPGATCPHCRGSFVESIEDEDIGNRTSELTSPSVETDPMVDICMMMSQPQQMHHCNHNRMHCPRMASSPPVDPLSQFFNHINQVVHQVNTASTYQPPSNIFAQNEGNTNTTSSSTSPRTTNSPSPSTSGSFANMVSSLVNSDFGAVTLNNFFTNTFGIRSTNPGDYAWGRNLEDILNNLFQSTGAKGNPPASQTVIDRLPIVNIQEEHVVNKIDCPICQEDFLVSEKALLLPCGHIFHSECVTRWLKMHNQCPVCRFEIEDKERGNSASRSTSQGSHKV